MHVSLRRSSPRSSSVLRATLTAALIAGGLGASGTASAADEAPAEIPLSAPAPSATATPGPAAQAAPAQEQRETTRWYGWQTLTVDGATLALAVGGSLAARNGVPSLLAGGIFILSGSVVHMVHERGLAALGSIGLRVGVPAGGTLIGALAGFALMSGSRSSSVPGGLIGAFFGGALGGGLGIIAASVLDATLLGHEKVLVPAEEANATKANAVSWFPTASVGPQGAHAGLAGTF